MRQLRLDDSSNVRGVTWREGDVAEVEFATGATYRYGNVQLHQFREMCAADSIGAWVQRTLVKNPKAYPCEKMSTAARLGMRETLQMVASLEMADDGDAADDRATMRTVIAAARAALE